MNSEYERRLAQRLCEETDLTEAQALELVSLLGANWSSLIREANTIKNGARSSSPAPSWAPSWM